MVTEHDDGSYWGVLPGEVKYDTELSISAKYLYVILTSRARSNGYCWPSNSTLAKETMLSKRRVVELLASLQERGYIKILFDKSDDGAIEQRRIYCGIFLDRNQGELDLTPCENSHHPHAGDDAPPRENSHNPHAKNTFAISSRNKKEEKQNEKQKEPAPVVEKGNGKKGAKSELTDEARDMLNAYVGTDRELAEAMKAMIENRTELKAVNSARAIKALLSELDRLSHGIRENKLALLRRAVASGWKIVYPMAPTELPVPPPASAVNGQAPPPQSAGRRYVRTEIVDGEEVDVYE